jgi:hypothetical protein
MTPLPKSPSFLHRSTHRWSRELLRALGQPERSRHSNRNFSISKKGDLSKARYLWAIAALLAALNARGPRVTAAGRARSREEMSWVQALSDVPSSPARVFSASFAKDPDYRGSGLTELRVSTPRGYLRASVDTLSMVERGIDELVCLHGMAAARSFVKEVFASTLFDEGEDLTDVQQELAPAFAERARQKIAQMRRLKAQCDACVNGVSDS